jgi:hypothetical protein
LLIGLPGSGVDVAARLVASLPGVALLTDRFGAAPRSDGFSEGENRFLELDDDQAHVLARRYARPLARTELAADTVLVDWLPAFDAHFLPLLHRLFGDTRLVVVTRDARESLLDWLALGSATGWRATPEAEAAAWLANGARHIAAAIARSGLPVLEVPAALLRDDPAAARAKIAAFLGIDVGDAALPATVPGLPTMLPAGHAARYASALG